MKQTVYVDVLVAVNIIADYFLLYAAALITGRKKERIRLCLAALEGGAGSLVILLPPMPTGVKILTAVVISSAMTLTAFGRSGLSSFIRTMLVLFALSTAYSGAALLIWCFAPEKRIAVNNGAVYIGINPGTLMLTTVIIYAVLSVFSGRLKGRNLKRLKCTVTVITPKGKANIEAIVDTGNTLTEPFSGLPVILVPRRHIAAIMPEGAEGFLAGEMSRGTVRMRAVPFHSAGGTGLLSAFIPEQIEIETPGRKYSRISAYIAAAPDGSIGEYALVNPDAIN